MKNLLSLTEKSKTEINRITEVAASMRRSVFQSFKKSPQLIGMAVGGVWEKPCASSTAFSLATTYLSGSMVPVFGADDPFEQCNLLDNMGANAVVVSCENDNLAKSFATRSVCSVINGGSGQYDPVGVLADLMAISMKCDGLQNLTVLAVGNRDTNKVNELIKVLEMYNSSLLWYLPQDDFVTQRKGIVIDKAEAAFHGADAVIDLGLSAFSDPVKYYGSSGGITENLMDLARINCPLLGCRTFVDKSGVREYPNNIVNIRESCYVAAAMASLYLTMKD